MNDEKIIRDEALTFAKYHLRIQGIVQPIKAFDKVKSRLYDFYSPEAKSIFLDEINKYVLNELQKHRDQSHGGKSDPTCGWENLNFRAIMKNVFICTIGGVALAERNSPSVRL